MIKITLTYDDGVEVIELSTSSMNTESLDKIKQYLLKPSSFNKQLEEKDLDEVLGVSYLTVQFITILQNEIDWITDEYAESEMFKVSIEI